MYLRRSVRYFSAVGDLERLLFERKFGELTRAVCALPRSTDESDWKKFIDAVFRVPDVGPVIPAIVITSANLGFGVPVIYRDQLIKAVKSVWTELSILDRVVFLIGLSQVGIRTSASVDLFQNFLAAELDHVPEKLIPALMLSVANYGIENGNGWNSLVSRVRVDTLSPHELANTALALATSKTFPISLLERVMDASVRVDFALDDALTMCHSLVCLELYRSDLIRRLLNIISDPRKLNSHQKLLLKQIILSLFIDPKAADILTSVAPDLLDRIGSHLDWSELEPQRHHHDIAGEIEQLISDNLDSTTGAGDAILPVPPRIYSWSFSTARDIVLNRFYMSDATVAGVPVFVHIDDETFADLSDGPIDPYIQIKHAQIERCGWKVLWVRETEWEAMDDEGRRDLVKRGIGRL
jgi:hypothetical protein